ncbi:MAG: TMEM43 family protein [Candidatus Kerfeldbacteria bacterium]
MDNKVYRTRKEGGIFSSLFGVLIGLGLVVIGSPLAAWYAESQHRAEDFSSAKVIEATAPETGYIATEGETSEADKLNCPVADEEGKVKDEKADDKKAVEGEAATDDTAKAQEPEKCLYVETDKQVYTRSEHEQCGTISENQTKIRYVGEECDQDGTNCESCYLVEEYDWESTETDSKYASFKLGVFTVTPSGSTTFFGTKSLTNYEYTESKNDPIEGDVRWVYDYMPLFKTLLIAGNAENDEVKAAYEGRPFVVSNLSHQGTLEALEAQDASTKWILRIVSLVLMVFGMILIVGPLMLFTNMFKFIPVVGKHIDRGFDGVLKFIASLVGIAMWIVVYSVVLLLKNIWIIFIVLVIIGAIVFVLVQRGKKKGKAPESAAPAPMDKPSEPQDKPPTQ